MRKLRWPLTWLAVAGLITLAAVYARFTLHLLGVDTQQSYSYNALSAFIPSAETGLGMSTLITGLWHSLNCHEPGCLRVGRHKVDGTPWCNRHHHGARRRATASLDDVVARLDALLRLLGGDAGGGPTIGG